MRKTTNVTDWHYEDEDDEVWVDGTVEYTITPGMKGCRTMRNGDPGYPDDPPEIEFGKVTITDFVKTYSFYEADEQGKIDLVDYEKPEVAQEYFEKIDQDALAEKLIDEWRWGCE